MEVGLAIVISLSLATLMTVAYRHQNLAPVVFSLVMKIGVLVGLAIPALLLIFPPESIVVSAPTSTSLSVVSNEISLRDALSMISCMLLGSFFMSAFLEQVRKSGHLGRDPSSANIPNMLIAGRAFLIKKA